MKKKILSVVLMVAMVFSVVGCNSNAETLESQIKDTEVTTTTMVGEVPSQRKVEYGINSEIDKYLHLDSETIESLDNFYLSAKASYNNMSPEYMTDNIYSAFTVFSEKITYIIDKFEPETEDEKIFKSKWISIYALPAAPLLGAGLTYSQGMMCAEKAAIEMLNSVDEICSNFYENYSPIFNPEQFEADNILSDYDENELSADTKYKNQLICVMGEVDEVAKDVFDNYYVSIGRPNDKYGHRIRCYFGLGFEDVISNLKKGDYVNVTIEVEENNIINVDSTLWYITTVE